MSMSGVQVDPAVEETFNKMKLKRHEPDARWAIFVIENKTTVVKHSIGEKAEGKTHEDFLNELKENWATEPCYALVDVDYQTEDGVARDKLAFVTWNPDDGPIKPKMLYSSTADTVKRKMPGIMKTFQFNDTSDLDADDFLEKMRA